MDWVHEFSKIGVVLPEPPDTSLFDRYRERVFEEMLKLQHNTNILTSDIPKVVVKIKASDFQKSKFKENYTFAFQSLITGGRSQYIPIKDRLLYGITDEDKINGGIYPELLELCDNVKKVNDYYFDVLGRIYKKRNEFLSDYHAEVDIIIRNRKSAFSEIYSEYLNSAEWKEKRIERLNIDGYVCVLCMSPDNLNIHHLTYRNVGNEDVYNDLVTVCQPCHAKIHRING